MTTKLKINNILDKLKEGIKQAKKPKQEKELIPPPGSIRVRDMRQEAMDQGAHGAGEYFKENQVG